MSEDQSLLQRAKRCYPDALGALHDRFYEPVYRYVNFKVRDQHTREDLTSEVFLRVLEGLKRGLGWRTSPAAWIFGIEGFLGCPASRLNTLWNPSMPGKS